MRGFVNLPTGQNPPSRASGLKQCGQDFFRHASLHIVSEDLQCHETTATLSDDRLTSLTLTRNIEKK